MDDFKMTMTTDPQTGVVLVTFPLTAQGSFAVVNGPARAVQNVMRWMGTPRGSIPYDPTYGNPFFDFLGTTQARDANGWVTWLRQTEYDFLQRQTRLIQVGNLAKDETVEAFTNEVVFFPSVFTVSLSFDVVLQSSVTVALPGPLFFNLG